MGTAAVFVLGPGFREMKVEFEPVVKGKLIGPQDIFLANRINRVDGDGELGFVTPGQGALIQPLARFPLFAGHLRVA